MAKNNLGFTYDSGKNPGLLEVPEPTKESLQRSLSPEDLFFARFSSPWVLPNNVSAATWRYWVKSQPVAMICRETLAAYIVALDWSIVPRKSSQRDELSSTIKYYTKLLENGGFYYGFDWTSLLEWILTDLHDLPFGLGMEVARKNDSPSGRVEWLKPLDAGTLYPTLNSEFPVVQYYQGYNVVAFPKHAISRECISPSPEIVREGWGLAPPEKIVLAMEMLDRGDRYYANLLLDIPPAGILDLGDMEKDSALEWVKAFRSFTQGKSDSFAIPVLYEHKADTKFIPFGKVPNDLMFDRITLKYASMVAAAYGLGLADIGLQSASASGETLAGSIRSERRTKRTGFARAKKKIQHLFNGILPDSLEFKFIDLDDELVVSLGRARLANATAQNLWIKSGQFNASEMRLQNLEDGLVNINIPEKPPKEGFIANPSENNSDTPPDKPGLLGYPQNASSGGQGEVLLSTVCVNKSDEIKGFIDNLVSDIFYRVHPTFIELSEIGYDLDEIEKNLNSLLFDNDDFFSITSDSTFDFSFTKSLLDINLLSDDINKICDNVGLLEVDKNLAIKNITENSLKIFNKFIATSIIYFIKKDIFNTYNVFDIKDIINYDSVIESVSAQIYENLDSLVNLCVSTDIKNLVQKEIYEVTNA